MVCHYRSNAIARFLACYIAARGIYVNMNTPVVLLYAYNERRGLDDILINRWLNIFWLNFYTPPQSAWEMKFNWDFQIVMKSLCGIQFDNFHLVTLVGDSIIGLDELKTCFVDSQTLRSDRKVSSNIFRIQFMFDEKKKLSINSTSSFTLTGWREERGESECAGFDLSPIGNLNSIFFSLLSPCFSGF